MLGFGGGVSERSIMNQTGHRSLTIVRCYIRDGQLFGELTSNNLPTADERTEKVKEGHLLVVLRRFAESGIGREIVLYPELSAGPF